MKPSSDTIVKEISNVLAQIQDVRPINKGGPDTQTAYKLINQNISLASSTIQRFTTVGSQHRKNLTSLEKYDPSVYSDMLNASAAAKGQLEALKTEYQNGYLNSVEDLLHADLFGDFMGMAFHLLQGNYYIAAGVIAGSVLEESLRKLCIKNDIPITRLKDDKEIPLMASAMNDALKGAGVYNNLTHKSVMSWIELRNLAAHGKYSEFSKEQVDGMYQGISLFLQQYPA